MPDMLVKLYNLPESSTLREEVKSEGIEIRRGIVPEKRLVSAWAKEHFSGAWADECEIAYARQPVSCFVAVKDNSLVGFACYDSTYRGFFGPTGVLESMRGKGVGKVLLLACLEAMYAEGYAYAIIGGAGPVDFYTKVANATVIPGSVPGIYKGMLRG